MGEFLVAVGAWTLRVLAVCAALATVGAAYRHAWLVHDLGWRAYFRRLGRAETWVLIAAALFLAAVFSMAYGITGRDVLTALFR